MLVENGFSYESVAKEMNFEPELKHTLSNEWKDWLNENIGKNQDKDGLFKILLMHGFSFDAIKTEMEYEPSVPLDELIDPLKINSEFKAATILNYIRVVKSLKKITFCRMQ